MRNAIATTHRLDFGVCEWKKPFVGRLIEWLLSEDNDDEYPNVDWLLFQVGTCEGQWRKTPEAYEILSIINHSPGNGHLMDLLEWFQYACERSKLPLRILSFTNDGFRQHLINKRGFHTFGNNDVEIFFPKTKNIN